MGVLRKSANFLFNFNKLDLSAQKNDEPRILGPVFESINMGEWAAQNRSQAMTEILKKLFDRYFKFYFAFCLLGFTILILLMNLPRVLADEKKESSNPTPTPIASPEVGPIKTVSIPEKFYRWPLPLSKHASISQCTVELNGNNLKFKLIF